MIHELKIWPEYFTAVITEIKTFEYRFKDRNYQVGDSLLLREYDPQKEQYTGRESMVYVSYILDVYDRHNNPYVIMSIIK